MKQAVSFTRTKLCKLEGVASVQFIIRDDYCQNNRTVTGYEWLLTRLEPHTARSIPSPRP